MLENGQKERFSGSIRQGIAEYVKTVAHVVQIGACVIEALHKFIEILLSVLVEHFELELQIDVLFAAEFLQPNRCITLRKRRVKLDSVPLGFPSDRRA